MLCVSGFSVSICVYTLCAALLRFPHFSVCDCCLCPWMEGHQNASSSTGPSELNRSYCTGNSPSVLHCSQRPPRFGSHLCAFAAHVSAVDRQHALMLSSTAHSCCIATVAHLPLGPICNVTGDAIPTSFDVALTQLSFLKFVQKRLGCSFSVHSATTICITRRCCCADRRTM